MKEHWLVMALAVFSVVLAASAVACSDDNKDAGGGAGTPAENTPVEGGGPVDVTMKEVDGSGVSGTATLVQTGQGLEVAISLSGLTPGTYQNHIHRHPAGATCPYPYGTYRNGAPGPTFSDMDFLAVALPDLVVDASGKVETTTTIPLTGVAGVGGAPVTSTLADFQDSNSKVEVYTPSSAFGLLACGDIPAR